MAIISEWRASLRQKHGELHDRSRPALHNARATLYGAFTCTEMKVTVDVVRENEETETPQPLEPSGQGIA